MITTTQKKETGKSSTTQEEGERRQHHPSGATSTTPQKDGTETSTTLKKDGTGVRHNRVALKLTLEEIAGAAESHDADMQQRGWKLFFLLPRVLLGSGTISKAKLVARFENIDAGQWTHLTTASEQCAEQDATAFQRRQRRQGQKGPDRRIARAQNLTELGEL